MVEKFGIWFGKPLWKKTINGVQYSLGSIPFGGFVALPQMAPMDAIEGAPDCGSRDACRRSSPLDKIVVAISGPGVFLSARDLFFACLVWAVGRPVSKQETTTTIGYVRPGFTRAEQAPSSAPDVPPGLHRGRQDSGGRRPSRASVHES